MDDPVCSQSSPCEVAGDKKPITWKDGLRLVDLYELARQMHCKTCTSLLDLNNTQNETRWGLASVLSVLCCYCHTLNDIYTGKAKETTDGKTVFDVNLKASVNMLLCGSAGQHVLHFLAVLDVPQQADDSIVVPSSYSPGSVSGGSGDSKEGCNIAAPFSPTIGPAPQGARETSFQGSPQDSSGPQVRITDRIKQEGCEEPTVARNQATNAPTICDGPETGGESDGQKTRRGKKRRMETADDVVYKAVSAQCNAVYKAVSAQCNAVYKAESAQCSAVQAEQEGESCELSVCVDDVRCKEEETGAHKAAPLLRKRYRCPLCAKVLPSSRGFHIHVGRKHQAPNLQAVLHEVTGPDDTSTADMGQTSDPVHSSPVPSGLSSALARQRDSAAVTSCAWSSWPSVGQPSSVSAAEDEVEGKPVAATEAGSCGEPDAVVSTQDQRPSKRSKPSRKTDVAGSKAVCRIGSCDKTFQSETLYQRHLQKVHGVASPFSCGQCGKQYCSQKSLNIHMTVAHCSEDERKAVCKYCGDTVQHRRALKKHIKAHHPRGIKRTFYCDECPATFPQPSALKNHKLRHAGIKNYQCFYCDKRFSGSGNRLNHMRYFHEKERKFLCDTCGAGFYRAYALREHERVHSGEKPYQCERCAERFTKKEYLTIHMRTHTGEKPYKCELCDKAFTQRTSRSLHRRKVHGLKKQEAPGSQTQKQIVINNKLVFVNA